ncbi:MAG: diguanylate cyclase [Firmicutes bacterium]|nr:diguanylate cyclase [Bacillota bacterium]
MSIMCESVRNNDVISRMGGDEFIILFPNCQQSFAEQIWHRITEKMEFINQSMTYPYQLSASYGMLEYCPDHDTTPAQLLSMADHIMYMDKESHRKKQVFN